MRFLQVGLGSMGKRRIRCLRALGQKDIVVFDSREDRRREAEQLFGVQTFDDFEQALATPDLAAVLVSTPPDRHDAFVKAALLAGKHTFCEANIVTDRARELEELAARAGVVAAPSATLRFHPLYQQLRRIVVDEAAFGKPLLLNFHMGNFILDWHPWEGLNFYAGRKATGACREMVPFEFLWMTWIFGPVREVQCEKARLLDIGAEIDDAYAIVARFDSGLLATVVIEVIARHAVREGRLLSQHGNIEWSFESAKLRHFDAATRSWREHKAAPGGFNLEEMYATEIETWLRACAGEVPWPHSYAADHELGRVLVACERSSETGARVRVQDVPA